MSSKRPVTRLAPDARAALLAYGARATWPGGFAIYQRAQPADGVFVVLSGRVVLRSRVKAGRGFVPVVAAEGETFGAEGLIPGSSYVTDARAEEPSETLHLSASQLRSCLREQPLVGATRESVSLVFNRLVSAGLVEREGTTFSVPDVGALAKRLSATWVEEDAAVPMSREDDGTMARA